jgi:hypothetical protein
MDRKYARTALLFDSVMEGETRFLASRRRGASSNTLLPPLGVATGLKA